MMVEMDRPKCRKRGGNFSAHNFFLPSGQSSCIIVVGSICRCDGIGRRSGLKIHRRRRRTGSTPVTGTTNGAPALQVRFGFSGGLMHRSKKAYKKHTRTLPLSQNDKVLYLVLICFSGALPFLTYLVLSVIRTQIAFVPPLYWPIQRISASFGHYRCAFSCCGAR